jgi:ABC-type transport system involved in multi-copper enzyme maturation permease subunit
VISVCGERQRGTLEGLFLLPVERKEILWAKWLGSILRVRVLGLALLATWGVGLVTGALHPWAVLLLAGACAAYMAFLASLGLCLSLVNRNVLWANLSMALTLLLLVAGALTSHVRFIEEPLAHADWKQSLFNIGFNPVRTLWLSGFSWHELIDGLRDEDSGLWPAYGSILLGLLIVSLAAWLLWRLACLRFSRELERRG